MITEEDYEFYADPRNWDSVGPDCVGPNVLPRLSRPVTVRFSLDVYEQLKTLHSPEGPFMADFIRRAVENELVREKESSNGSV